MRKFISGFILVCGSLSVFAAEQQAVTVGKWRVFSDELPNTVTLVLRSNDDTADMDLFCDQIDYEVSVYLKKKPEQGDLISFVVSLDGNKQPEQDWQANSKTRSTTVKTSNQDFINSLNNHQTLSITYSLTHAESRTVDFSLADFQQAFAKAKSVCRAN